MTEAKELTLVDIVALLKRRWLSTLLIAAVIFGASIVLAVLLPRKYEATSTIRVEKEGSDSLNLGTAPGIPTSPDALQSDIEVQTQSSMLGSNTLALRVIGKLKLLQLAEFQRRPGTAGGAGDEHARELDTALRVFHKNLSVKPQAGTHLIAVSYLDRDPALATRIVNQLVQELMDAGAEARARAATSASENLSGQLADLRQQSQGLQARVADMQRDAGIYSIGTTDASGHQQAYSAVLEQFQRAASVMSEAEGNRISKQAVYQAATAGDAEMLSSLAGTGTSNAGINTSLTTIQVLRAQEATQQAQLDQLRVKFGSGYPRVAELQASIAAVQQSIRQEVARIAQRATTDYDVANRVYGNALANYQKLKTQADALNDKAINYMLVRQEADESRTLYENLLSRLKEADILKGLSSGTVTVVDPALVPETPSKPNLALLLGAGLLGGLFVGGARALLSDALDDTIHNVGSLDDMRLPTFAVLPSAKSRRLRRSARAYSRSMLYEDTIRNLRSDLAHAVSSARPLVLMVASTTEQARESAWLAFSLAQSFSRGNRRTLLVQADLRGADLTPDDAVISHGTLSQLLLGSSRQPATALATRSSEPYMIHGGTASEEVLELLDSSRMEALLRGWRETFDVIVLHAPPVLPTGARSLAQYADMVLLVARAGVTTRSEARQAYGMLAGYTKQPVGLILDCGASSMEEQVRSYGYSIEGKRPEEKMHEQAA